MVQRAVDSVSNEGIEMWGDGDGDMKVNYDYHLIINLISNESIAALGKEVKECLEVSSPLLYCLFFLLFVIVYFSPFY